MNQKGNQYKFKKDLVRGGWWHTESTPMALHTEYFCQDRYESGECALWDNYKFAHHMKKIYPINIKQSSINTSEKWLLNKYKTELYKYWRQR